MTVPNGESGEAPASTMVDEAPPSPLDDVLNSLDDDSFDDIEGGDVDAGAGDAPADEEKPEGEEKGEASLDDESDDGDELENDESEEGDEGDGEKDTGLEDGEALVTVPDSLKEQGYEDFVVPEDQKELFEALTSSYESRSERETAQTKMEEYESELYAEAEDFRLAASTNPLQVIEAVYGGDKAAAEEVATLHLMSDPEVWKAHVERVNKLSDKDEFALAKRELEINHRDRVQTAGAKIQAQNSARDHASKVKARITSILDQIDEGDRDFVKSRLLADVRAEMRRGADEGSALLELSAIDTLADPWLKRFGVRKADSADDKKPSKADKKKVEAAQSRIRAKARKRAEAKRVAPSGDRGSSKDGPKKGTQLDDVLAALKKGKL